VSINLAGLEEWVRLLDIAADVDITKILTMHESRKFFQKIANSIGLVGL
jgi:hypothetical protein